MFHSVGGLFIPTNYQVPETPTEAQVPLQLIKAAPKNPHLFPNRLGSDPFRVSWQLSYLRNTIAYQYCYTHSPWVWSAIETIVQSCTMDMYSIETEDDDLRHAMEIFLYNVAPRSSFDEMLRSIYRDLSICGNWYGRIFYKGKVPVGISRVHFTQIVPDIPEDGSNVIKTFSIYPAGPEGSAAFQLQANEVLHLKANNMGDNGTGLSQLECLDMTLGLERFASEYQNGFFVNGVKAGDVYASDGSMSPETYQRDKVYLESYTAADRSYAPMFLAGKWELISRGQDLRKDADFLALRNYNREEILSVFSIPMSLVSTDKVGTLGSNGKSEDREYFLNMVVAPLQKLVFEDFNRQFIVGILRNENVRLLPPGRPRVRLDDVKAAAEMTKAGFTGNEIRSALNLDLIEGLDEPMYIFPGGAIIGIPGDPESIFFTRMGPISGAPFALPDIVKEGDDITDPLQSGDEYARLKEKRVNQPQYQQLKEQAGNQPTANTLSQSNDAYGTKQNMITNPAANANGPVPNNSAINNTNRKPMVPQPKTTTTPPAKRKKKRPTPQGRHRRPNE